MTNCLAEKELNTVVLKHKCTNCMACYNVCPVSAIEIKEDKEGFAYPVINEEKCTHCGLCTKKCPALNLGQTKEISERLDAPIAYGGYIKDEEIREKSSSGGAFSALAKYILDKGGYVCGARIVQGGFCEHVIVDNWEDLAPLRGSKYVQSNINNCYKEIKTLLEQDKYVLFTGTPCQVAGLYAVLGEDYEKLITVDILCHGVPSQKVFREYLNEITDGRANDVLNVNFKEKSLGWNTPSLTIDGSDVSIIIPNFYANDDVKNSYGLAFVKNLILRQSCTDCKYNRLKRMGDFTIGDFWGVENHYKELYDNKGLSVILLNSPKAKNIIEEIKKDFSQLKDVSLDTISRYNLVNSRSRIHPHAAYFREKYSKGEYSSLCTLIKECLEKNDGIAILNFADVTTNYGSCLVGFSLQQKIKQLGYTPVNIMLYDNENRLDLSNFKDFQSRYMNFTAPVANSLKGLNKYFQTFIVGGDCVFLNYGDDAGADFYRLGWVDFSKNIASYAASFSYEKLKRFRKKIGLTQYRADEIKKFKRQLKRFSHLAVRENTGVKICKDNFNIKATQVMDSVFLLSPDEWRTLASRAVPTTSYIGKKVRYTITWKNLPDGIHEYLNKKENIESLYTGDDFSVSIWGKNFKAQGPTIENWVKAISECDILYTDSFHGTCFAVMFNKPFITFFSKEGYNRVKSLIETLGLPDRNALTIEDVKRLENEPIDYTVANERLKEMLKISEDYLEDVLRSHEHPDPVRGYMESLELLVEEKSAQKNGTTMVKTHTPPPYPNKQKWYFVGIHVFKIAMRKGEKWFYLFGVPLVKEVKKEHNTYYKLFGFIRVLKKAVRG